MPKGIKYIPEIVIHGVSLGAVQNAMRVGIGAILDMDDIVRISAGNFGGRLGEHKIFLRQLWK